MRWAHTERFACWRQWSLHGKTEKCILRTSCQAETSTRNIASSVGSKDVREREDVTHRKSDCALRCQRERRVWQSAKGLDVRERSKIFWVSSRWSWIQVAYWIKSSRLSMKGKLGLLTKPAVEGGWKPALGVNGHHSIWNFQRRESESRCASLENSKGRRAIYTWRVKWDKQYICIM